MKANTPQTRKAKGRRLTQEVCFQIWAYIQRWWGPLNASDVKTVPSGVQGVDVWLSEAAQSYFPFSVECKNQEALNIWACLKQAEKNTSHDTVPLLVFKRNGSKIYACLPFDDFLLSLGRAKVS